MVDLSEVKVALREAVARTIENMGLEQFKQTPFFGSSDFYKNENQHGGTND